MKQYSQATLQAFDELRRAVGGCDAVMMISTHTDEEKQLVWEKIKRGQYRTVGGRFTASRINRGRCFPVIWRLVDNRTRQKFDLQRQRDCTARAAEIITEENESK